MKAAAAQPNVIRMKLTTEYRMKGSSSAVRPNALQKWGSLFCAVLFAASAIVGYFEDERFTRLMTPAFLAVVAGSIALQYWRRS